MAIGEHGRYTEQIPPDISNESSRLSRQNSLDGRAPGRIQNAASQGYSRRLCNDHKLLEVVTGREGASITYWCDLASHADIRQAIPADNYRNRGQLQVNRPRKSTMVELVDELRNLPQSEGVQLMIEEALAGEYHDYKNVRYVCGKMESSRKLRNLGHVDLAKRIEQGEFDEEADAEDDAMLRKELDAHGAGRLKGILGLDEPTKH